MNHISTVSDEKSVVAIFHWERKKEDDAYSNKETPSNIVTRVHKEGRSKPSIHSKTLKATYPLLLIHIS